MGVLAYLQQFRSDPKLRTVHSEQCAEAAFVSAAYRKASQEKSDPSLVKIEGVGGCVTSVTDHAQNTAVPQTGRHQKWTNSSRSKTPA